MATDDDCGAASAGACYLAVAGAVLGTNRAVGGASEVITGQEQLTPAEWSAIKAGMKPEDARQLIGWVETGVATVTIVQGVAIITKGGAVIAAKEVATNRTVSVPKSVGADLPSVPVHNINAFFDTITGRVFKSASSRTAKVYQGQRVYKADADIVLQDGSKIRKGDQFYLDGLHKNHLEVFDARGNPRIKVDLAGKNLGNLPADRILP
ncbi:MAG: hypothetical protein Q4G14_03280 [Paracoccus sp. (in: a-proteobacteria)]|uniref:hypothetical protein n=1 Tax=Paracoccus sp. TaxID=267 RepID=UPI0026DF7AE6|nr:hypothetical protein [Paracoccus sp. (in: a-proteobacteria)]MDO5612248.1 hypothetical protein [Paracoccus sp. (in: a-proteobacteria)]